MSVVDTYQYPDAEDAFSREPFVVKALDHTSEKWKIQDKISGKLVYSFILSKKVL